ncbi:Sporulation related domain-containing protein [Formivibrio citricus]|uniref:Sporulation related domain-containing protein n=1 Tax=Formivibrio citricus TaxID=83765 RepID=A0A1I5DPW9_9NEIS|nr:SPOR domain-containing protein [Formivibrio citricus]SFO01299.1 Sporulation related domain-containing protein [Formivibrio citricus]
MKWLFFVFLLANALVLAVIQFGGGAAPIDPRGREINASQVRVVTGQLASKTKDARASLPASAPASLPAQVAAPVPQTADKAPAAPSVCLRWSGITLEQAPQARNRLKALGLSAAESGGAENAKFWVYVPPQSTLAEARKKAQQIADLGVDDYFVVNDGKRWQNAISLGVFSSREAGERRLAELREKGVRSAILRDKEDTLKPVTFLLRNVSPDNRKKLEKASGQLRGAELKEVVCR